MFARKGTKEAPADRVQDHAASMSLKPIFLLADSQLLFWREDNRPFGQRLRQELETDRPRAAYVGASNGDEAEFFRLFRDAMSAIGVSHCTLIHSCFTGEDLEHLAAADLILLSGGDVERGWKIFDAVGLKDAIVSAYSRGAVLIGVSAGAVQLGLGSYAATGTNNFVYTFGLVPFIISAHDEQSDWHDLRRAVTRERGDARGIGLPAGAGMICHSDRSVEPLRKSLSEFSWVGGEMKRSLLIPNATPDVCDDRST